MSVWISSGAFAAKTLEELLVEAGAASLDRVELSSGLSGTLDLKHALRLAMSSGKEFLIHNYFPAPQKPFVLNIAAQDDATRCESLAFACRAIDLAVEVGAPFYSIHAGFAAALSPDMLGKPDLQSEFLEGNRIDREFALDNMCESTRFLADYAEERGLDLLLENNVVAPSQVLDGHGDHLLMTSPSETDQFLSSVDRGNVGLLLDVAHAKVSGNALNFDPKDFFDRCGRWIKALHLSDNDGTTDNNQPFSEQSWFMNYLQIYTACPMVIEVYRIDPNTIMQQRRILDMVINR